MADAPLPRPKMDWSSDDKAQALQDFKQLCDMWFKVKNTEKKLQHNYIMLWLGSEGLRLLNTWNLTVEQLEDPKNIWDRLQLLQPPQNFRIHRLEMQRLTQRTGESVEDFCTRCRTKAIKCKYTDKAAEDERVLEQLIAGTSISTVQRELLSRDSTLTLATALELAKSHEATANHMRQMQELTATGSTIDAIRAKDSRACGNCGGKHPPRQCPAYGTKCSKCLRPNHWQKVCRSSTSGSTDRPGHAAQSLQQHKPRGRRRGRPGHQQGGRKHINAVQDISDDDPTDDFACLDFSSIETNNGDNRDELYASLDIKYSMPASLRVKVDTGAQGNILPLRIYRRMFPEQLNPEGFPATGATELRRTVLQAYNGTLIKQFGVITIQCKFKKTEWHDAEFFVTDSNGPAILGLPSSRQLKLVTVHCAIQTAAAPALKPVKNASDLERTYPDRFEGIGNFEGELHITLKEGAQAVVQPPRKYPIQLLDEIKSELKKMENIGVITPVTEPTDWVNALAFSRKASGGLRVCLDPRALNQCIKRTHHKTPTIKEITNRLSGSKVFSKLDAKHGYWAIKLDEESSMLTTFNSSVGRFRFNRLPFGLNVSQDAFQQAMDRILSQCPGTIGITDDVIVHGKDEEDHDRNLHHLMDVARKCGLVFNSDKCHIKTSQIKFFGMIYDLEGVHPDPDKCSEIQALPAPKSVTDVQRFLGIVQFMSPFIPKLSDKTAPLRALTKKGVSFEWNSSLQKVFDDLKASICKDTALSFFDVSKKTTIQVDASKIGVGAALLQDGKPIAFASKALTDTEQRYANIERELLAVVFGCTRFHTYIYGKHFVVESDHKPLEQVQKKSLASTPPRLQRMMLQLQHYDVTIQYRLGKEMILADSLSRLNPTPSKSISLEQSIYAVQFSSDRLQELRQKTDADPDLAALRDTIIDGWPDNAKLLPKRLRDYWSCKDELSVEDDLVLKGDRIIIPAAMQAYILQNIHAGHQGSEKCKLRAKTCVYWRGINTHIDDWVKRCNVCQSNLNSQQAETLLPHDVPTRPWQNVGTDLFHFDGKEYILVSDYFSKMPFIRRLPAQPTSTSVITALKQLFSEHGIPTKVISDNGPQYDSNEFTTFSAEWGFQHVTSSPRYPQSNGFAERMVQTVKKTLLKAKQSNSDPDLALLCLRTTPIDSSLPSPAELLYSRNLQSNLPHLAKPTPYNRKARRNLQVRQQTQKKYHDRSARDLPPLHTGQKVQMQENNGTWIPATVVNKRPKPRSYTIRTPNGGIYRRNRRQLRDLPTMQKRLTWADQQQDASLRPPRQDTPQPVNNTPQRSDNTESTVPTTLRRSNRHTQQPQRLIQTM
ncbi:hypothetical protein V1264_022553 [Littorina saxatilis]|uniref:Endonuclease n=1 Tax=Littorina saxatilis TaxID=31220 RepID=A0AAN9FXX4_9CAEN